MHHVPIIEMRRHYSKEGPEYFKRMRNEHGDVLHSNVPLLSEIYYLFHPDDIHAALVKQAQSFDKSRLIQRMTANSFGNGLFLSTGDEWKRQRKLMQPSFHHVHIQKYTERIVKIAQQQVNIWQDGASYLLDTETHALAFRVVMDVLFSADASDQTDKIATAMHDLGAGLEAQANNPLLALMPDWMPIPILQRKRQGQRMMDEMIAQAIEDRRGMGEANAPHDLLSLLVFSRDEDTGAFMSEQQIHDELVTLYIAGHETTALLIAWAFALLAQYPEVEAQFHQELDTILVGQAPTLEKMAELPTLNGIIKETLRLYPPSWFVIREAIEDVDLPNAHIPKGAICFFISYATQRDGRFFAEPDAFKPERWADDFEKSLPKGSYFPFGLGARICIGNGLALLEAQLVLAILAQAYRVELLDTPDTKKTDLTLGFLNPVRAKVHQR